MTEQTLPGPTSSEQEAKTISRKIDSKGAARVSWMSVATNAEAGTQTAPLRRTNAVRGKYADKPSSSDDFATRKQEEIDLEERRR